MVVMGDASAGLSMVALTIMRSFVLYEETANDPRNTIVGNHRIITLANFPILFSPSNTRFL